MTIKITQPAPEGLPIRFQARSMGVYAVAHRTVTHEGRWHVSRGYTWMARTARWTKLATDHNLTPPRTTEAQARADHDATRAANRRIR